MRENFSTEKKKITTSYKLPGTMATISKEFAWFSLKAIIDNDSEFNIFVWVTQSGQDLEKKKNWSALFGDSQVEASKRGTESLKHSSEYRAELQFTVHQQHVTQGWVII